MSSFYEKLFSQAACPRGFWGRFLALRLMPMGHKPMYEKAAPALDLQPEDDFLEVAFGSGIFIKRYASHVRSVAGLDRSGDMVKLAAKVNRRLVKAGKADFRQGKASQLPWKDDRFTAAAIMGAFEVFPEPLEPIKELYRVLRPGGRLVIVLGAHAEDGRDHSRDIALGEKCYTANEMESMFKEAGFTSVSVTLSSSKYGRGHPDIMTIKGIKKQKERGKK